MGIWEMLSVNTLERRMFIMPKTLATGLVTLSPAFVTEDDRRSHALEEY